MNVAHMEEALTNPPLTKAPSMEHQLREAIHMIGLCYRLAPKSTPANLRNAILDAERVARGERSHTGDN